MTLFTKDLLINLLFLVIMCLIANISKGFIKNTIQKKWMHFLIGGMAIVGCISFGVKVNSEVIFDLRQIPFILVGLMEGPIVCISLFALTVISRSFFGGEGIYATVTVYSLLTIIVIYTRPYYIKGRTPQKFFIGLLLSIFCSLLMNVSLQFFGYSIWSSMELLVSYILIPALGMLLLQSITEGIQQYFLLRNEIIKTEKIQMISNLAASFGHEVRNPICVSKGFLQLLLEDEVVKEKRKEYMITALVELERAEKIINNYLTFAKPQYAKKEVLPISDEIKMAVEIVEPMANMNNVIVNFKKSSIKIKEFMIEGERDSLHQCLLNLLKNAIEAMPNGGKLNVEIFDQNDLVGISITDTGMGMTKDQIQRLGEPYFSLKEKGTGLGMMVVFSIVKSMNGRINISSEIGKGTSFTLLFPTLERSIQDQNQAS